MPTATLRRRTRHPNIDQYICGACSDGDEAGHLAGVGVALDLIDGWTSTFGSVRPAARRLFRRAVCFAGAWLVPASAARSAVQQRNTATPPTNTALQHSPVANDVRKQSQSTALPAARDEEAMGSNPVTRPLVRDIIHYRLLYAVSAE